MPPEFRISSRLIKLHRRPIGLKQVSVAPTDQFQFQKTVVFIGKQVKRQFRSIPIEKLTGHPKGALASVRRAFIALDFKLDT